MPAAAGAVPVTISTALGLRLPTRPVWRLDDGDRLVATPPMFVIGDPRGGSNGGPPVRPTSRSRDLSRGLSRAGPRYPTGTAAIVAPQIGSGSRQTMATFDAVRCGSRSLPSRHERCPFRRVPRRIQPDRGSSQSRIPPSSSLPGQIDTSCRRWAGGIRRRHLRHCIVMTASAPHRDHS